MPQLEIPFLFMRGGTSRGAYFQRKDLPEDRNLLENTLLAAMGAGHPLNIDGIGGSSEVTTKVAILSPSSDTSTDVDYLFAQVDGARGIVDFGPTCGNILAGVGPAAIEMGLVEAQNYITHVKIRAVNTGAHITAKVKTPEKCVEYEGSTHIDGVPGTAAGIVLEFRGVVGSSTGKILPTGEPRTLIDGLEVSCVDVAMPLVLVRASDINISGYESTEELAANKELLTKLEGIHLKAGQLMGLGDTGRKVIPKFAALAKARNGGDITARYFTPWAPHPSMALTGAQCIATSMLYKGTIAEDFYTPTLSQSDDQPTVIQIEHPSGHIDVVIHCKNDGGKFQFISASLIRTARLLARGSICIPSNAWHNPT
ncbi:4-oxalomesaconate tautomerase [Flexibacterium corallicola]|uniref:4-oxalomesaconate tautomerase n=1 Tax=Flexibacterium corallicola TaxID=3037259 RepID=UPI00286EC2D7|nr:4-oxalomesaconate tautomerase [Pseudovibrio sp. M1P-2-3]